jgi:serine/threonine protein kinase
LDKRGNEYIPVIIDFGKSRPTSQPKGPKALKTADERKKYKKKFPHIAHEIVDGNGGQTTSSDIFSLAKIFKEIYQKCQFGELPNIIDRALS